MNCTQHDCEATPTHIVYWPGKVPPPKYCLIHAIKAVAILRAMGCPVAIESIMENK